MDDVSEGQVRRSQVRIGKVKTSQVMTGQDRCLEGVSKVSGGYLWDDRMVCQVSFDNFELVVKVFKQLSFCSIITSETYEGGVQDLR